MSAVQRVAVIGAGPGGLICTRELLAAGLSVTCFEAGDGIGGVYRRCYDGARLTTLNLIVAFSDFPDPAGSSPRYWRAAEYVDYLEAFAARFGLHPHIRLQAPVSRVRRLGAETWGVTPADTGIEERFDAVIIATGVNTTPRRPRWPGEETFQGELLHVSRYRTPAPFAGKRVLIVGGGESAADVSLEIAQVAASSALSLRGHGHITPRHLTLRPGRRRPGNAGINRVMLNLPRHPRLVRFYGRLSMEILLRASRGRDEVQAELARRNLAQGTHALCRFGTKSDGFIRAHIEHGTRIVGEIARLEPGGVVLRDGSRLAVDAIVCCTGYRPRYPFLERDHPALAERAQRPDALYRTCIDPETGPRLAWCGFARPVFGPIPPICEMQARWLAALLTGRCSLPPPETLHEEITADRVRHRAWFGTGAERIPALVDYLHYVDTIATDLGIRPRLSAMLLREPIRLYKVLTSPFPAAQYRLHGPGAAAARAQLDALPISRYPEAVLPLLIGSLLHALRWLGVPVDHPAARS